MKNKKFFIPYKEDKRMAYAAEYLYSNGMRESCVADDADFVLLPIPTKKYMLDGLEDKTVFYATGNYKGYDYNKDEDFLLKNAFLTTEGAIALYKENSDIALYNADILISGYGRIGKSLHKALNAFGANVTVCSRSEKSRTLAEHNSAKSIDFAEISSGANYDAVFNTVPKVVFSEKETKALTSKTLFIELASFPGGIDTHCARDYSVNLIDGKGLAGRYSPQTAGYLIGETVLKMSEEVMV
ncbi:MAG: hypothetical protein LUG95_01065 [Clostridiales bacterium]|nr:hypothetical protein [Clostridiales bacterium]